MWMANGDCFLLQATDVFLLLFGLLLLVVVVVVVVVTTCIFCF